MLKRILVICALAPFFISSAFADGVDDFTLKIKNHVSETGYKFYAYLSKRDPSGGSITYGPINLEKFNNGLHIENQWTSCHAWVTVRICKLEDGKAPDQTCNNGILVYSNAIYKRYEGTEPKGCSIKDKPSDGSFYFEGLDVAPDYSVQHFIANSRYNAEYLISLNKF